MPYNILLLPLLAGYLFLSQSRLRAYATARLPKDQLLLAAAAHGFLFLLVSRITCYGLLQTDWGLAFAKILHRAAPFDFIGTALGTLIFAGLLITFSNTFVSERVAGFWLYHRRELDPLTRILWSSSVGAEAVLPKGVFFFTLTLAKKMLRFFWKEIGLVKFLKTPLGELPEILAILRTRGLEFSGLAHGEPKTIMVNMKDGKVLVGYVIDLPTNNPSVDFVTVSPLWTGYRDSANQVLKSVDYSRAFEAASEKPNSAEDPAIFARVIRSGDISSVSVFSKGAFDIQSSLKLSELPKKQGLFTRLISAFRG
ncbi:hypothetical protein [Xanthomonas medicagonis]|uniref:hypothetical protein n=1 Tax=Xanthomonas medicagonis TaxID=3160841 RepID=UPI0035187E6C